MSQVLIYQSGHGGGLSGLIETISLNPFLTEKLRSRDSFFCPSIRSSRVWEICPNVLLFRPKLYIWVSKDEEKKKKVEEVEEEE